MAKFVKILSFLLAAINFIACTGEAEFLVPQSQDAVAASVTAFKLLAKEKDGTPVPNVTFEITAYHRDGALSLQDSGTTDDSGTFLYYLDNSEGWAYVWVKSMDDRFPGSTKLDISGKSIVHTWVATGN